MPDVSGSSETPRSGAPMMAVAVSAVSPPPAPS
jgi:hypothetical protein